MKKPALKRFKQNPIVLSLSSCIAILRSPARIALSSFLAFSLVACNQSGTTHGPTTINQFGGDKNDPGGYEGSGGTGDGGGGQGILCSADTKNPALKSKLLVRDIFEAIHNSKLTIKHLKSSSADPMDVSDEAIELLISSLKSYFGPAMSQLEVGNKTFWKEFIKNISFISEDAALYPSQDANSPIALPAGCRIAQIAFWDDSNGKNETGTLYIDKQRWQELDQVNKVALLAHEYYFKEARQAGFNNSDSVRSKVGQIFSNEGVLPLFKSWQPSNAPIASEILPAAKEGFKLCTGFSEDDPNAKLLMYQYRGKDKEQHLVFPLISSTVLSINPLLNQEYTLLNMNRDLIAGTNLMLAGGHELDRDETDTRRFGNIADLKLTEASLLDFPQETSGMHDDPVIEPPSMLSFLTHLENVDRKELWSDTIKVNQGFLKIHILNSLSERVVKASSSYELMVQVQNQFLKELKSIVPDNNWASAQTDLLQMINQLHADLKLAQSDGQKADFKKFKNKFDTFIIKYVAHNAESQSNIEAEIDGNENHSSENTEEWQKNLNDARANLRDSVASLMLKASLNLLTEKELRENSYFAPVKTAATYYAKTKISISNNSGTTVNFTLTCEDADRIYSKEFNKISKNIIPDFNTSRDYDKNPILVSGSVEAHPDTETQSQIISFVNYLAAGGRATSTYDETQCYNEENFNDICTLRARLANAKKLQYSSCSAGSSQIEADAVTDSVEMCIQVTFPEDNSRYLVWGSSQESLQRILDAKQMSPIPRY